MTTAAQLKKLALAMPGAEEKAHFEQPDFRVGGKIFAGLSPEGDRGTVRLPPDLQAAAMSTNPSGFSPAPGAWGRSGWTYVHLAHVELGQLRELIAVAWRGVAPKRLVHEYDSASAPAPPRRRRAPTKPR